MLGSKSQEVRKLHTRRRLVFPTSNVALQLIPQVFAEVALLGIIPGATSLYCSLLHGKPRDKLASGFHPAGRTAAVSDGYRLKIS